MLLDRNEPDDGARGGLRQDFSRKLQCDVEKTLGADDDVADAAELIEDDLLMRDLVAADFEPSQLLAAKAADEETVPPTWIPRTGVEAHSRRRERWREVDHWLLHALL